MRKADNIDGRKLSLVRIYDSGSKDQRPMSASNNKRLTAALAIFDYCVELLVS